MVPKPGAYRANEAMVIGLAMVMVWVVVATVADMCFKNAGTIRSFSFSGGIALYVLTGFVAFWTYRLKEWGYISIVWSSTALAVGLALSVGIYHEPFSLRRRIAALLVLAAILIAE